MGPPVRFPYRHELRHPVIGLEAEFKAFVDGDEVIPEEYWRTPAGFVDRPLLRRTSKSSQLPTGGALYFDGGVIEVVTPVIEIAPECTARVVRSLWEQIGFVRDQLDRWEKRTGHTARLQAFSCHFNISFELPREQRNRNRTIQKLALLLAHLLPVPVIILAANRRSTGIGVRPRRDRIEITLDFTPDPGLMAATAALIVGVVREVIRWPSYRLEELQSRKLPVLDGVTPGKHPTRNGWVARDFHFPQNPFTTRLDDETWELRGGGRASLRQVGFAIASTFRDSILETSDSFSEQVLFSVLGGDTPSLLDLEDRPPAYDDVGRSTRWGAVIPELENFAALTKSEGPQRRRADVDVPLAPPWRGEPLDRRERVRLPAPADRRGVDRRASPQPKPSPRLSRSDYEKVFLRLGTGKHLRLGDEELVPVEVKGWYHAVFEAPDGEKRLLSIDDLADHLDGFHA